MSSLTAHAALVGLCAWAVSCSQVTFYEVDTDSVLVERRVVQMGTSLGIELRADSRGEGLLASEAAVRAVEAAEQRLSTWREDSELSQLNAAPVGAAFAMSDELRDDLRQAAKWAGQTGGAFDPAVGALIDLYALRAGGRWPTTGVAEACAASGLRNVRVDADGAHRLVANVWLDAGAFGKGAALDRAAAAALAAGAHGGVFDFGGQLHCFGTPTPRTFQIADPAQRDRAALAITIDRGSLATTANSERRLQVGDRTLGHILDPRTGRPAADFGSVTVWAENAFAADCLSTALFVMGPDEALTFAERTDGVEAVVVQQHESRLTVRATSGLRHRVAALRADIAIP